MRDDERGILKELPVARCRVEAFLFGLVTHLGVLAIPVATVPESRSEPGGDDGSFDWWRINECALGIAGLPATGPERRRGRLQTARMICSYFARAGAEVHAIDRQSLSGAAMKVWEFALIGEDAPREPIRLITDLELFAGEIPDTLVPTESYLRILAGLHPAVAEISANLDLDGRVWRNGEIRFGVGELQAVLAISGRGHVGASFAYEEGVMTMTIEQCEGAIDLAGMTDLKIGLGEIRLQLGRLLSLRAGDQLTFPVETPYEVSLECFGCRIASGWLTLDEKGACLKISEIDFQKKLAQSGNLFDSGTINQTGAERRRA